MTTVLVVDDDRGIPLLLREAFRDSDVEIKSAATATAGLEMVAHEHPDLVLLDVMLPDMSGFEVLQEIKRLDSKLPVIFITASNTSDTAIEAVKGGAYDYLVKPLDLAGVRTLVERALEVRRMMHVSVALHDSDEEKSTVDRMVGRSPAMMEVYKAIGRVAPQNVTVLIRGESGTGKELIARAIYQHSLRSSAPFLAVNCAAIPEALLESELFGHEKGSFTGADRQRIGKFEQCTGGTIFLDEIGDMAPLLQGKLLRLLQEQRFERVGGNQTIQTDVRIITATHRDLEAMSSAGTFRSDLYYRLNGFTIAVPPLRERREDLMLLFERFFSLYARQLGKVVQGIAPDALKLLAEYPWPGNIRELQTAVRSALLKTNGPVLVAEALPDEIRFGSRPRSAERRPDSAGAPESPAGTFERLLDRELRADSAGFYNTALAHMERHLLTRVLSLTSGNQSHASRILGITRGSLRNKISQHGILIVNKVESEEEKEEDIDNSISLASAVPGD
jgi:two-component system nitrogen regulation response regulator GlnG